MNTTIETQAASIQQVLSVVLGPFADFPRNYEIALGNLKYAAEIKDHNAVCLAFADIGALRPVRQTFPSNSSKTERAAVMNQNRSANDLHDSALDRAAEVMQAHGAKLTKKRSGGISASGTASIRTAHVVAFKAPRYATVRL